MNKARVYWWCQGLGWTLYGVLNFAIYIFIRGEFVKNELIVGSFQIVFYIISTHLLRAIIKKYDWAKLSPYRLIPTIILSDLILGVFNYFALLIWSYAFDILVLSVELKAVNMIFGVVGPAAMYFLWSLIYFAFHYFEQHNKSLQYEALIKDAELQHLKSQLNPHFIFNALNSIKALVDEDPKKSKSAITQLSSIFRNSLSAEKKKIVRLEEEMNTVKAYLGLESIRFEERLEVSYQVQEDALHCMIPPMMIQTLVENGVKHGIAKLKEGGSIGIKIFSENDQLKIEIRNTGNFEQSFNPEGGYGLTNTKERLNIIYGNTAFFEIKNESNNLVLTSITIPKNINDEITNN